ncbi:hypothetical protein GCM10011504_28090 [Siccirubricoccus deserti]|nr:hypothetical protein GCM10011504_28090 [Siccirubricoccus deserti]
MRCYATLPAAASLAADRSGPPLATGQWDNLPAPSAGLRCLSRLAAAAPLMQRCRRRERIAEGRDLPGASIRSANTGLQRIAFRHGRNPLQAPKELP